MFRRPGRVAATREIGKGSHPLQGNRSVAEHTLRGTPFFPYRVPIIDMFGWLFGGSGYGTDELFRRLATTEAELSRVNVTYREFTLPKKSGGRRPIQAPVPELKRLQRRILRRLLARLAVHPAAMAFEPGRSIVINANHHRGRAVVLRFDLVDFFGSTSARKVEKYFRYIGWNRKATRLLVRWCTQDDSLPQGAPTSPRLSNLVNYRLDTRLAGMAVKLGGVYTRYADDITLSFGDNALSAFEFQHGSSGNPFTGELMEEPMRPTPGDPIGIVSRLVPKIAREEGYRVHRRKKQSVRRRHQCQQVTGLVVNETVNLPRKNRRWLRAVEHRAQVTQGRSLQSTEPLSYSRRKTPTLTPEQLQGWRSLVSMVERQADRE